MTDRDRIDPLTGALNKRGFEELLRERGNAVGRPFSVAIIDLDAFGKVQRYFGPIVGDSIVMTEFNRMKRILAGEAVLARLGVGTFGLVSQPLDDPERLRVKLEELRDALRASITIGGLSIAMTACIGAAFWLPGGPPVEEVFEQAQLGVVTARDCGGDQVAMLTPSSPAYRPALRRIA